MSSGSFSSTSVSSSSSSVKFVSSAERYSLLSSKKLNSKLIFSSNILLCVNEQNCFSLCIKLVTFGKLPLKLILNNLFSSSSISELSNHLWLKKFIHDILSFGFILHKEFIKSKHSSDTLTLTIIFFFFYFFN